MSLIRAGHVSGAPSQLFRVHPGGGDIHQAGGRGGSVGDLLLPAGEEADGKSGYCQPKESSTQNIFRMVFVVRDPGE